MVEVDIARTSEQFRQCRELYERAYPDLEPPPFGAEGHVTYIVYDSGDPSTVRGMIQGRHAFEAYGLCVDPEYKYIQAGMTLLDGFMRGCVRATGARYYFYVARKASERIVQILTKAGARRVDEGAVRLMKEL